MRTGTVEIYSDASNAAVLRHPDRRFPGMLIQGDTLHSLVQSMQRVSVESASLSQDAADELGDVLGHLQELMTHYQSVLMEHGIELPFRDKPGV